MDDYDVNVSAPTRDIMTRSLRTIPSDDDAEVMADVNRAASDVSASASVATEGYGSVAGTQTADVQPSNTSAMSNDDDVNICVQENGVERTLSPETSAFKTLRCTDNANGPAEVPIVPSEESEFEKLLPTTSGDVDVDVDRTQTPITSYATTTTPTRSAHPQLANSNISVNRIKGNENNNKNALAAFGDYIAFIFRKAESYEEELEQQQSQSDLQVKLDNKQHGGSMRYNGSRIELSAQEEEGEEEDGNMEGSVKGQENGSFRSSPELSPSMEALAAVEAMSNFRSLTKVKRELSTSFDRGDKNHHQKGQKVEEITVSSASEMETTTTESDEVTTDDASASEWEAFCSEKKQNKFSEVAIHGISLPLTVDEFHNLVLKDNAHHSIGKFMTMIGDFDVETTPWEPPAGAKGQPATRTIHYSHPVNVPMAPPTAKAFKKQYLNKFGSTGLCLESCTIVEDVPMTDCFVVDDRLWVSKDPDNCGCIVGVSFQIRFVKGTMFRRIIENATRGEFQKWWGEFGNMVSSLEGSVKRISMKDGGLEAVAVELEEAIMMLEEGYEGYEVPFAKVLGRIRTSLRHLSAVSRLASPKNVAVQAKDDTLVHGYIKSSCDFIVSVVEQLASEYGNGFVGACVVVLFMAVLNLLVIRQMTAMSSALSDLALQLERTAKVNEALATQMSSCACASSV